MQTLDALGAGGTLISHDSNIRGAGNLLGDEQSRRSAPLEVIHP